MSNPNSPESLPAPESNESFEDLLSQFEKSHARKTTDGTRQIEATVVALTDESVLFDIGYKIEGVLPRTAFQPNETVKPGDKIPVTVKGRNEEGFYELSRFKERRPTDWDALEKAFNDKAVIGATVTGVVKGGLTVDVGVRAFLPASRSGTRDAAEMEKLVGQEIRCRITKVDIADEDVVVDRRAVLEEEERASSDRRYSELKEGDIVSGAVRSLTDYGAFIDLGGVDGLLHVGEISRSRISKPSDVLAVGQQVEAKILKIDTEKRRISLGMKQLQADPWESVAEKYKTGERVRGTVSRVADFGAFVELEPGVEGLIHISEMSWSKRARTAGDLVKPGESVEAIVLGVNTADRRISLGLKQTLGDPWVEAARKLALGSEVEGTVTNLMKFGAFVQLAEGVEGMVHVSEISAEKRINHPQDVLKVGQAVKVLVLAIDPEKRQLRLSMKQLAPSGLTEFIAEHKAGDVVTGRVSEITADVAQVELGEGTIGLCRIKSVAPAAEENTSEQKVDLSSLSNMLQARWKGSDAVSKSKPQTVQTGQIRSFRITKLDPAEKKIELEMA
ncbi:MAG TPA: 30S ribosomal protein S1 [Terriglobales bacterium]